MRKLEVNNIQRFDYADQPYPITNSQVGRAPPPDPLQRGRKFSALQEISAK